MKDVHGPDGWKLEIRFTTQPNSANTIIRVVHHRQAQNLENPDSPQHFIVEWDLDVTMNMQLTRCFSTTVRVKNIIFHDDVDPEEQSRINKKLFGGKLIFH